MDGIAHSPLVYFFCMDVRRRLFFWSPITMMYPGGGEERLAASHLYPPFLVYFFRRPEKGLEQRPRFWFSFPQRNTRLSLGSRNISTLLMSTSTLPGE